MSKTGRPRHPRAVEVAAAVLRRELSIAEAAKAAGVSVRTVQRWARRPLDRTDKPGPGELFADDDTPEQAALARLSPLQRRILARRMRERGAARDFVAGVLVVSRATLRNYEARDRGEPPRPRKPKPKPKP